MHMVTCRCIAYLQMTVLAGGLKHELEPHVDKQQ
jgi:hypothetical protein